MSPETENDPLDELGLHDDGRSGGQKDNGPRTGNAEAEDLTKGALAEQPKAKSYTNPPGDASAFEARRACAAEPAPVYVTMFTSDDRTLSKRYELGADGRLVKDGSASILRSGRARRVSVPTATALAAVLESCEQNEAFLCSRFSDPNLQETGIGPRGRVEVGQISRTKKNFVFASGLGWCPIDVDGFTGDARAALIDTIPELATSAYVVRRSTSFGIVNILTEERFAGDGWHISALLKVQSDLPRFLEDLHKRLWLKGYGWIKLSAAGTMLERSPVDLAMRVPVQPVFEGAPDLGPGLAQAHRPASAHDGGALDTVRACPPLSAAEEAEYNRLVAEAKALKRPEAEANRDVWVDERVAALVAKGMPEADARACLFATADSCALPPQFELQFDRLGVVTVADVLTNPETYVDQTLADPHEGTAYGRGTAMPMREPEGLWIRSFAHGGMAYYFERETGADDWFDLSGEQIAELAEKERVRAEKAAKDDAHWKEKAAGAEDAKPDDDAGTQGAELAELKKKLGVVHASAYRGVPSPPMEWFVKDLIPAYDFTVINGDGGVGKSLLGLQLQICSVAKRGWLGMPVKHGPAIFFSGEDSKDENHRRLERIARAEGIDLGDLDDLMILNKAGKKVTLMSKGMTGVAFANNALAGFGTANDDGSPRVDRHRQQCLDVWG